MKNEKGNEPVRESISDSIKNFKESKSNITPTMSDKPFTNENFKNTMNSNTDMDLVVGYEIVHLPSKGLFYESKISEVAVEYMTSKDEDLLTTPSLIENGTVLDILINRKIKTKGIRSEDLLAGDREAIILFLRTSSYGVDYKVEVPDPRTGVFFKTSVDLSKLEWKEIKKTPNDNGLFSVEIPMGKKLIQFRLLTSAEEVQISKKAIALKEAYMQEFSEYRTMLLKQHIMSIDGNSDRVYIERFVDSMRVLDALTIRKEIIGVSPGIDMKTKFTCLDGYEFWANLQVGPDFFFPEI